MTVTTMAMPVPGITLDQTDKFFNRQKNDYSGQHPQSHTHIVPVAFVFSFAVTMPMTVVIVSVAMPMAMTIVRVWLDGVGNQVKERIT